MGGGEGELTERSCFSRSRTPVLGCDIFGVSFVLSCAEMQRCRDRSMQRCKGERKRKRASERAGQRVHFFTNSQRSISGLAPWLSRRVRNVAGIFTYTCAWPDLTADETTQTLIVTHLLSDTQRIEVKCSSSYISVHSTPLSQHPNPRPRHSTFTCTPTPRARFDSMVTHATSTSLLPGYRTSGQGHCTPACASARGQ